jgi:hypothetical protein
MHIKVRERKKKNKTRKIISLITARTIWTLEKTPKNHIIIIHFSTFVFVFLFCCFSGVKGERKITGRGSQPTMLRS